MSDLDPVELLGGVRARVEQFARAAGQSPADWLKARGLDPLVYGYSPAPAPPTTTSTTSSGPSAYEVANALRASVARLEAKVARKIRKAEKRAAKGR